MNRKVSAVICKFQRDKVSLLLLSHRSIDVKVPRQQFYEFKFLGNWSFVMGRIPRCFPVDVWEVCGGLRWIENSPRVPARNKHEPYSCCCLRIQLCGPCLCYCFRVTLNLFVVDSQRFSEILSDLQTTLKLDVAILVSYERPISDDEPKPQKNCIFLAGCPLLS